MIWRQLHGLQPLAPDAGLAVIRSWAADRRSPVIALEARASASQVHYLLGVPSDLRQSIEQRLLTAVPTVRITEPTKRRSPVSMAGQIRLSTRHRALRTDDPEAVIRQLLGALARTDDQELLVLQLILGPRRVPLAIPNQSPSSVVMPWYQVAWMGNGNIVDPEKRAGLRAKVSDHGFACAIRLGVIARTPARRRGLLEDLFGALRTSETPGLGMKLVPGSAAQLNAVHVPWRWPLRLNTGEVFACTAWPIGDDDLPGLSPVRPRPIAPTHTATAGDRVIGHPTADGVPGMVGYSITDALRQTWLLGPNGTGKTTAMLNLIDQDLRAHRPVVVIEPKDLISELLQRIPPERQDDIVLLDPQDAAPVGLNPLTGHGRRPDVVADGLFNLFAALYGDSIGPRSSDILRNSLAVLAAHRRASLVMLPLLLTNTGFRRSLTQGIARRDPINAGPFWAWFESLGDDHRMQIVQPLQNKIRPLTAPGLRAVLGQRQPRFDLRQVLRERKVLLVPLQKGVIGPATAELLAALVINELWLAIRERAAITPSQRIPVMVYLDELQDYQRTSLDLADVLATSRSLGAAWHLANQASSQLLPPVRSALIANARNRICFALTPDDARLMTTGQSVLSAEDFVRLPAYHAYAALLHDNTVQPWASVITEPAPAVCSDPEAIRARSRHRYGQPLDVIEADFAALAGFAPAAPAEGPVGRRKRTDS